MRNLFRTIINRLDGKPTGARGQSLVELTLTLPILIAMILSMTEIAFLANNYLALMDATREAARNAVTRNPTTWPVGDARNFQRLDCDINANAYNLFGDNNAGGYGNRGLANPRATNLTAFGYATKPTDNNPLSFFDGTACYAISILAPVIFDDTATGKDDVVVSAISFATINFNDPISGQPNLIGARGPKANALLNATQGIAPGTTNQYNSRFHTLVTGRWPLENRMCVVPGGDEYSSDYRDPFDYLRPEWQTQYRVLSGGVGVLKNTTVAPASDENEMGYNIDGSISPAPFRLLGTGTSQGVRGYSFSGKQEWQGCYGSQFTVTRLEDMLNSAQFSQNYLRGKTANGGLVLVEMQFQHHPFFLGAIFNRNGTSENDPLLNVYAIFPVPQAEPTATPKAN